MRHHERPGVYREKLWPAWWVFLATALVIPATLLVFLPISVLAGYVTAAVLYAAIVVILLVTTPTIEVGDGMLRAGKARIERSFLGRATAHTGAEAFAERGTRLDARAWLLLRPWLSGVVRVELRDPDDPTPYWLLSTRRPEELAAALNGAVADD